MRVLLMLTGVLLVCSVAMTAMAGATVSAPAATVTLRSDAVVASETVLLHQVASIVGGPAAVDLLAQVVLARQLAPGASIRISATRVRTVLTEAGFDGKAVVVTGASEVLVRSLPATMIHPSNSATVRSKGSVAVQRGATVQVVAAIGAIRVSATGVALSAGAIGEVIAVRVLATRREVSAEVIAPTLVAVRF